MPDELVSDRALTVQHIKAAWDNLLLREGEDIVEAPEAVCDYPRLCGPEGCRFPRYARGGEPSGLVAKLLIQLGYPVQLLLDLDREYEMSEVLHPGVKIWRSRNAALSRIDERGMALLTYIQDRQKIGKSWGELRRSAFAGRKLLRRRDERRRPWCY